MEKLNRSFRLSVEVDGGNTIEINPPFTIEFDIARNLLSTGSSSSIRIRNLSRTVRDLIRKDRNSWNVPRTVELAAGYGNNLPVIFRGMIQYAHSQRQGTDIVTMIEAQDAGFVLLNAQVDKSYPAGTPRRTIVDDLVRSLGPYVKPGVIEGVEGTIPRGNTISGNASDLLKSILGEGFFIDNGVLNAIGDDTALEGAVQVIESGSGLLSSPVREETIVYFDMLFEPMLLLGQYVELNSSVEPKLNGGYKIVSLKHSGTISDAVGGAITTNVGLLFGSQYTLARRES